MRPSELDAERWRRIDEIFDAALDRTSDERDRFLDEACAGDEELRNEVEALLAAHIHGESSFEEPVSDLGAALLASTGPDAAGPQVGPFRVLREIGRGGMGVVYLAEDTRLGRHVALKVLPPYLGVGPEARQRFTAEARAVSTLDHPNIATLFETDATEEGQLYMAFAFYEGETLDARIADGALSREQALEIAVGIAEGLGAAHERRIVHRDVKPSNVLLTAGGEVKLLDFGVAKVAGEELTGEGVRPGTVAYMSPEHAGGESVDGRSDLWSLGVLLHEMLTGERPFRGSDPVSLLHAILHDEPEPLSLPGDDEPDDDLETVVRKLLSKSPDERYSGAGDLLRDLRALQHGEPPSVAIRTPPRPTSTAHAGGRGVPRPRPRWSRLVPIALLGLAATALGVWAAAELLGPGASTGVERIESLAVLPLRNLTGDTAQRSFVDGVHDALVAELGSLGGPRVLSRTSVLRYRGTDLSIPEIARELQVDGVLEGSVLREGDSLRVTIQLIATAPERHLWSGTWRRSVEGVFDLLGEVARSVAAELELGGGPGETRPLVERSVHPDAWDAYTLGRFSLEQRSPASFRQAERYLRRAIRIDPGFAPAYATLAQAYGSAAFFGLTRPSRTIPTVRALADTAIQLDSTWAPAHATLAAVALYWDWNWDEAERRARRAVDLNPSHPEAHDILSEILAVRGRLRESLASVRRGSELERLVPFAEFRPVVVLNYMREYDQAVREARAGLRFFPDFWQGHWLLCEALGAQRLFDQATEACETAVERSGRTAQALGTLAWVHARSGRLAAAEAIARELEARAADAYVSPSSIAVVHGALGDLDRAFLWMERAYVERDFTLVHLGHHAVFDPLRADPRFGELWRRVGLESAPPGVEG